MELESMESVRPDGGPRPREPVNNIVIVGAMGSGKSSVGWLVARNLGFGFIDLDERIERSEKMGINQIFAEKGEGYFRGVEKQMIESLRGIRGHVIATGGGAVVDDDNWEMFREMGVTVWLSTSAHEVARRLVGSETELKKRPLLAELLEESDLRTRQKLLAERLSALIGQRQARYKQADVVLEDSFSTAESTAKQLASALKEEGYVRPQREDGPLDRWGTL